MPAQGVYTLPNYGAGGGTGEAPRLGAISSNIGRDATTNNIIAQIKKDAEKDGLTQWGFSYLRQFGERIDPSWLKESSKAWYNKPPVNWMVPPKDDFLKIVEPAVRTSTGGFNAAVRDKGGFGGLWEKYHKEEGDLEQQYQKLPDFLQPDWASPERVQERLDVINATPMGSPINFSGGGTPAAPPNTGTSLGGPNPYAAQDAIDRAAREAEMMRQRGLISSSFNAPKPAGIPEEFLATNFEVPAEKNLTPKQRRELAAYRQARQEHSDKWYADNGYRPSVVPGSKGATPGAPTAPGAPATPAGTGSAPGGERIDSGTYDNGVFVPSGSGRQPTAEEIAAAVAGANAGGSAGGNPISRTTLARTPNRDGIGPNFLPPYLQPGGAGASTNSVDSILARYNGAGAQGALPPLPVGSPPPQQGAPFAPGGTSIPGAVPTGPLPGALPIGSGAGGFAATAKMLELPFYLRNLGGIGRPNRRMSNA